MMHISQCNYLMAVVIMGIARVKNRERDREIKTQRVREKKGASLGSLLPTFFHYNN